jgi:hypothetical protein
MPVPKEPPVARGLTLEESLVRYAGAQEQMWDTERVPVYYLDPLRFDAFKAELDAGGEFRQFDQWTGTRDWEQGKTFARWAARPNGVFDLSLCTADNTEAGYRYRKVSRAAGAKLAESLSRYVIPREETWGKETVTVYALDPLQFEEFKVELDAGDALYQAYRNDFNRDWSRGTAFARWAARADGTFELTLGNRDNTTVEYTYKQTRQAGETWEEVWDEGRITFTYLGLTDPGFVIDPDSDRDGGRPQYKGYYRMTYLDQGGYSVYIYYPDTGRAAQYSKPLPRGR